MASRGVNKVIILGNLGKDPETRSFPNGGSVTNITVATSESWRDKQTGEQKEKTEWHNIAIFGKLAEIAAEYARKGSQVYIEGALQTRKWQDANGQDRYTTEIVIQGFNGVFQLVGSRPDGGNGQGNQGGQQQGGNQGRQPQQQNNNQGRGQGRQPANNNNNNNNNQGWGNQGQGQGQPQQNNNNQGGYNNNNQGQPQQNNNNNNNGGGGYAAAKQGNGNNQGQQPQQNQQQGFNEPSNDFDDDIPF